MDGITKKNLCQPGYLCNQNGIALVAGLILMTVLSLLIFTAVKYSTTDITRTKNYTETLQATYIAEAGIHRALGDFNYDASGGPARGKRTMALMTNWTIATGHLARLPILVWVAGGGHLFGCH